MKSKRIDRLIYDEDDLENLLEFIKKAVKDGWSENQDCDIRVDIEYTDEVD